MSEDTHPKSDQFNAFTPQARAVVVWACEEARTLGHGQVVAGHVVLGLLREPFTFAAALLTAAGMELEQVRGRLRPLVASRPKDSATPIAFSESAVQIFRQLESSPSYTIPVASAASTCCWLY